VDDVRARGCRRWTSSASAGWKSPFRRTTTAANREARSFGRTPLAAGENRYTRFEFDRVIEDGAITILRPTSPSAAASPEALAHRRPRLRRGSSDPSAQLE